MKLQARIEKLESALVRPQAGCTHDTRCSSCGTVGRCYVCDPRTSLEHTELIATISGLRAAVARQPRIETKSESFTLNECPTCGAVPDEMLARLRAHIGLVSENV